MKKISVILTTFNGSKTVNKTIDSILNQDGVNAEFTIELIAIDDCSTDNTYALLEQYEGIILKNERNFGGPNKGRNRGLKVATGDFICIVDQDDVWMKDKIKSMLPYLDLAPIVTSGYEVIDTSNDSIIKRVKTADSGFVLYKKNETFIKNLTKSSRGQNAYLGSGLFSKKLKHFRFEEHFGVGDFDWGLRMLHQQTSIEVCKSLYRRVVDGSNLSFSDTYRKYDFYYSLMTLEDYQEDYPAEVAIGYKRIYGTRARYYYFIGNMKKARVYFLRSQWNLKTLLYYITTFAGSKFVKKYFNVFGV